MKKSERGEIITIGVVAAGIIIGILGFMAGASGIRKWVPGFNQNENKTKIVSVSKSESKPIIVTGPDGKPYILQATKTEVSNSDLSEEQKLSVWQRLAVLPKLWLLLMVLGLFFPPIAALMGVFNQKLKGAVKQMVAGVENGLNSVTPEAKKILLDELSKKYDSGTKALVSEMKRKI